MKKLTGPLALVVALHIILGVVFGLVTPLFEVPDEANHFLFVRYLQLYHTLPVQTLDQDGPRAHHPPLYFVLGALMSAGVPNAGGADRVAPPQNQNLNFRYGDQANDHKEKFIHSAAEAWPFQGQALAVHLIRLLSTVFSALAVLFTYLAARELMPGRPGVALLAAAVLAFNPMVLFMSGAVQNSTSALASSAVLIYGLSRWLRRGFTLGRWAWLGVIFALSVLFQVSALTLAAPVGLALLYDAWRARRFQRLVASGLAFGLPVLALTGWWFVRNQLLYGDWTANAIVAALWSDQPIMPTVQVLHLLVTGMVGRFGFGLIIEYADALYWVYWLAVLLCAVGWVRPVWSSFRSWLVSQGSWRERLRAWLTDEVMLWALHAATVAGVAAGLAAYIIWFIRGGHGRYMFTAYPSLAILLAAGGLALLPRRWQGWATAGVSLAALALPIYSVMGILIPTYAVPRTPSAAELQQARPLSANIGDTVEVLGYTLSAPSTAPDKDLTVTIYWKPLSQTDVPYTVFVHLYSPETGIVAQCDTYPGQGNYATTVWDVGRPVVEACRFHLPPDAPAVSHARILLGLYDKQTMQRLPVVGPNAGPAEDAWVEFGDIAIQP